MGAQFSKNAAKGETTAAEKPGEAVAASPSKANGQENGHVKVNGDASPAAAEASKEEVQANGSAPAEESVKEEQSPSEPASEKETAEAESTDPASPAEGESSSKTEEGATPSSSNETPKKKKEALFLQEVF